MNHLIDFFARQKTFPELMTILVIIGGLFALSSIRREAFPNVDFDTVIVTTIYSGASPKEVEDLISSPLEEDIREVTGIKKMYSISIEGRSEIIIQVDSDQVTTDEVKDDVQLIVDRFQDIPEDAEDPVVTVVESKIMPVIEIALSSKKDAVELKRIAKFVERETENIDEVSNVDLTGEKKYEYRIKIDINKLQKNDISLQEILTALSETNVTIPAGDFVFRNKNLQQDMVVRTTGEFENAKDIENLIIRTSDLGRSIQISDIADVEFRLAEPNKLYRTLGKSAVRLVVKKKEKADAINLVNNLHEKMDELKQHPNLEGVNVEYINDSSYYIKNRLGILTNNLILGLILVLLILSLFLPVRVALIASIGIPFSFLAAIWVFDYAGFSLNMISVMGLIIVIGMVVDDAIVVIENSVRYMEDGLAPIEATIKGTQSIWKAVFASVMTTVLAFWPMITITGIFGKFIKYIPYAVILALVASMIEAFFILPSHYARWVGPIDKTKVPRFKQKFEFYWQKLVHFYGRILKKLIQTPWCYVTLMGFVVFFIASSLFASKKLRFILFPADGVEIFMVKMEAPRGSSLYQTQDLIRPVENAIQEIPKDELMNYIISIGAQSSKGDPASRKQGSQYAQATVYLTPENQRNRIASEIITDFKEKLGRPKDLKIIVDRAKPGPPVGSSINVGVRGDSFKDIESALKLLQKEISTWPGSKDLDINYKYAKDEKILNYKPLEASLAGLTVQTIGLNVRALYEGLVPTTMRGENEEIDVRVSFQEDQQSLKLLHKLKILNPRGVLVPLDQVVEVKESRGIEAIYHEASERQFTLSGDIDTEKTTSLLITQKIKDWIDNNLREKYPKLEFVFGGENEDTGESLASLKKTFVLSLLLIFFILIMTFGNFYQPFLIITAIPLGVIAVLWALILHGQPLSFMAILGVIALAGVIVNNAIVFIDFINEGIKRGLDRKEATVRAGQLRLRAVTLTTATTVFGLLPTAYGIGGLDKFVVPIALSLGWGMLIGSIMVMIFIPVLYTVVENIRAKIFKTKRS